MTDAGPPTTVPTPAPDLPRLPDAAPAPTPAPTPDPHPEPAAVEPDERPAPESSGTPVGFFVLMLMIVAAIIAIAAVVRPWESGPDDTEPATSVEASAPSPAPATTGPATTPATTASPTTAPASSATTILVVAPLPTTEAAGNTDAPLDPFEARTEACATEQRTLEVAVEAYVISTGEQPNDPEELVTEGLLRPDPEGWSTRWAFAVGDGGVITVVPVPGGACDL